MRALYLRIGLFKIRLIMKKLLLTFAGLALVATTTTAQIFNASDSVDFAAFTAVDADADGANWQFIDISGFTAQHFADRGGVLMSESWNPNTGALTPDNFLITPEINLAGETTLALDFRAGVFDPDWAAEKISVYVVTDTSMAAISQATAVYTETLSGADTLAEVRTVDISSFAGQTVHVVFRHHDVTDQYVMFIDDIAVKSTATVKETILEATVAPNPTQDFLNVSTDVDVEMIEIYSMDGRKLMQTAGNKADVQSLASGMYRYAITAKDGRLATGAFVKM